MRRLIALLAVVAFPWYPAALAQEGGGEPKPERTAEQAQKDATAIHALYDKYKDAFEGVYGGVSVSETSLAATLKLCEEHAAKLQSLEQTALPEIQPLLAGVLDLWGKPPDEEAQKLAKDDPAQYAMNQSGDIEWNMKMAAAGGDVRAARDLPEVFDNLGTRFTDLARMLANVQKTREANAEYLVDSVKNGYSPDMIDFFVEDIRVDKLKEAKTLLGWALKFDSTNEYANARMATIDGDIAALQKQIEADIDARTWAGNVGDFAGPGSVTGLAQAGLEYLRNDRDWGKNANGTEVLAVCVRGGWQPADRDLFGRIISWRLPVHVAATRPALKEKNVARVYELSMVAKEGPPGGAPKAPPFDGYWVGDSWNMRLNKVPQ
jgi:hypothetical protein